MRSLTSLIVLLTGSYLFHHFIEYATSHKDVRKVHRFSGAVGLLAGVFVIIYIFNK